MARTWLFALSKREKVLKKLIKVNKFIDIVIQARQKQAKKTFFAILRRRRPSEARGSVGVFLQSFFGRLFSLPALK